jgi:hypothetical protein
MAVGCICGVPNTGLDPCPVDSAPIKGLIFVKMIADDGTKNSIDVETVFDQDALDDLVNQSDSSKRFFPVMSGDLFAVTYTDPTATNGQFGALYYALKTSGKSLLFTVADASELNAESWQSGFGCGQWGVYAVDSLGQVYGYISTDGTELYPARIATGSFIATFKQADFDTNLPNRVELKFAFDTIANKGINARIMTGITADVLGATGLQNVDFEYSDVSATGFTLKAYRQSATASKVPQTGLLQTNFTIKNKVTDVTVASTAFAEVADGEYDFTYASQTSGVKLYTALDRVGLDGLQLSQQTVTIP